VTAATTSACRLHDAERALLLYEWEASEAPQAGEQIVTPRGHRYEIVRREWGFEAIASGERPVVHLIARALK
jgi:hypothetical protein